MTFDNIAFGGRTPKPPLEPYINDDEPLYGKQTWIFEAINVSGAWEMGYTGHKVRVRINDVNWVHNHTEWTEGIRLINFNENAEMNYTCGDYFNDFVNGDEVINNNTDTLNHGAAITSILGADGTNNFCGSGIAPLTRLSYCRFDPNTTHPKVLAYNVISQEIGASKNSFDISMNAFAYEGCSSEPRGEIIGLHRHIHRTNQSAPIRRLQQQQQEIKSCPFVNFRADKRNPGDDPCRVCTGSDFDAVNLGVKDDHDNIFDPISATKLSLEIPREDSGGRSNSVGVSKACATSVRAYCLRNFLRDEAACTEFIDVINDGNICRFKSNVGEANEDSFEKGAKEGRFGRGVTFIFAAGDSHGNGDHLSFQAYPKSRYIMTVGAIKMKKIRNGNNQTKTLEPMHATYSTTGSSLFVVAPGGDYDSNRQHVGAGQMANWPVWNSCDDIGYGSSYAASVVGGVVALILEANEYLHYRDIRAIIALTSKPVIILDKELKNKDTTFEVNAAGFGYSELYGFGLIDATAAIEEAKKWYNEERTMPPELTVEVRSGEVNVNIFDDSFSTSTSTIWIKNDDGPMESASVYLKLRYFDRGNLRITLTSPSGTTSLLSPGGRHEYGQLECDEWWEFLTLRSWGESPYGNWTLAITDTKPGNGDVVCIDRPTFAVPTYESHLNMTLTCQEFESEEFCVDGGMNENDYRLYNEDLNKTLFERKHGKCDLTALDACCVCGGGMRPDDDEMLYNQLVEWKIKLGDGIPKSGTKRLSNYDPHLPEVTDYEFIRCRYQTVHGERLECCNGSEVTCGLRVNEMLFATLHDGMTEFEGGDYVRMNQEFETERALEAGYRAFKLDVCNCNGELEFCSAGICNKITKRFVTDVIMYFREFFERNPSEIAVLFFNIRDDVDKKVDLHEFWLEMMQVKGLPQITYTHDSPNSGNPWPTLREMIALNKRLVMFHYNGPNCTETPSDCPPELHYYSDWIADNNDHVFMDPVEIHNRTNSCHVNRTEKMKQPNTFVGLRNFVKPFSLKEIGKVNAIRDATELQDYNIVQDYVESCENKFGRDVNFIMDDWWGVGNVLRMTQDYNNGRALGEKWVAPTPSPTEDPNDTEPPTSYPTFFPTFALATPAPTQSNHPSMDPTGGPTGPYDPCPEHKDDCNGCKKKIDDCLWCKSTSTCYNRNVFGNIFDLDDEILPCAGEDILDSFDYTCEVRAPLASVFDDDRILDDDSLNNETSSLDDDAIATPSPTATPTTLAPTEIPTIQPIYIPLITPTGLLPKIFGNNSGASSLTVVSWGSSMIALSGLLILLCNV